MGEGDKFNISDGDVFGDGSCLYSNFRPLSRAGFAVAQVDAQGNVIKAIFGCMPRSLPQTSLVAEYAAFTNFIDNIDEGCYVGDCQEVIDRFNDPMAKSVESSNPLACFWKTIAGRHGDDLSGRVRGVFKTKAHRREVDVGEGIDRFRFNGNNVADRLAKQGAELHKPAPEDAVRCKSERSDVINLAYHMIDVLKTIRLNRAKNRQRVKRLPEGVRFVAEKPQPMQHHFIWHKSIWFCSVCLTRTLLPATAVRNKCSGSPPFKGLLKDPKGHCLWSAGLRGGGVIIYCTKCYFYASPHPRKLNKPCEGFPPTAGSCEEFYLSRRQHPVSKERLLRPSRVNPSRL